MSDTPTEGLTSARDPRSYMVKSRRALLKAVGGAALGGALAGCIGGGSGEDDAGQQTPTPLNISETGTAPPVSMLPDRDYTYWLVDPRTMGTDHYQFQSVAPQPLLAIGSPIESTPLYRSLTDPLGGVTMGDVERIHMLGQRLSAEPEAPFCKVVKRGIDLAAAKEAVQTDLGLAPNGRYGEYFLFKHQDQSAAVKSDRLLLTESSKGLSFLRLVVDTSRREGRRYQEASEACGVLVETLGTDADVIYGRTNEPGAVFPGGVAKGAAWTKTGEGLRFQAVIVFESESATDAGAVESWAGSESPVAGASDLGVETSGRTVTATATLTPADVAAFRPNWSGEAGSGGGSTASGSDETTAGADETTTAGGEAGSDDETTSGGGPESGGATTTTG